MSVIASIPKKRIIACSVGQSNELGHARTFDGLTDFSFQSEIGACADPVTPNGTTAGSMWPSFVDYLARDNIHVTFKNTAVGGTALVEDWLGDSVGDGTGTPKASGDAGFDPNSYLSDALSYIDAGGYDEAWAFIAFGQKDGGNNVSLVNYQLALENVTNYFLDSGVKVALGMTVNNPAINTWLSTNGNPALAAALSTFSSNNNVVAGGNLYSEWGTNYGYLQADAVHMVPRGFDMAAKVWYTALNNTVFTT